MSVGQPRPLSDDEFEDFAEKLTRFVDTLRPEERRFVERMVAHSAYVRGESDPRGFEAESLPEFLSTLQGAYEAEVSEPPTSSIGSIIAGS